MINLFHHRSAISPVESAQATVDKLLARRDRIAEQLAAVEQELAADKAAASENALANGSLVSDFARDIAEGQATTAALSDALLKATEELRAGEQSLAEARDLAERERSIAEINSIVAAIDEPLQRLLAALADLTGAVRRGADISLDAKSLLGFLELASAELPVASAATVTALKHSAALIELGSTPARLPAPEVKPTIAPTPQPVTHSVVTKFDIQWTNDAGMICYCKQHWDCGLPVLVAERAIAHGVVVDATSDEAKKLRQKRLGTSFNVDFGRCTDLDVDPPRHPDPLPEKWINPNGVQKWSDMPVRTSAPLGSWIGGQSRPTNTEQY